MRDHRKLRTAVLAAVGVFALACPALAAPPPPKFMDVRYKSELKNGAPPEGAPKAKDVPRGPGSLSGVWYNSDIVHLDETGTRIPDELIVTETGDPPPMQPATKAIYDQRIKEFNEGRPYAGSKSKCMPAGLPRMMLEPQLMGIEIIETPKRVTILIEQFNNFRQINMTDKHNDLAPSDSFMGDSIGHWEGDTLVVETIGLNTNTVFDKYGTPHSNELKVLERYRRVSKDRLELKMTFDDPKAFTKPWSLPRRTLKLDPEAKLVEFLCENQRNTTDEDGSIGITVSSTDK